MAAVDAYDANSGVYDQVFAEIGQRIREADEAGKLDLAALIMWKRSGQGSWVKDLLANPEPEVRAITRDAFAIMGDQRVLRTLATLPGFTSQGPIATALMARATPTTEASSTFARPTRWLSSVGRLVRSAARPCAT
ncbi:MAG: hypothetical protein ACR2FF_09120 [Mycobacteriales bacterium]